MPDRRSSRPRNARFRGPGDEIGAGHRLARSSPRLGIDVHPVPAVVELHDGWPLHSRSPSRPVPLAHEGPRSREARRGGVLEVAGDVVLHEGVVGVATPGDEGVDVVRADSERRRAAPGGEGAVLRGEHVGLEVRELVPGVDIGDDPHHATLDEPFGGPGARDARDARLHGDEVGPVGQVGADGDSEVVLRIAAARGHRIGVGEVILPVGVPHDAGIPEVAGVPPEPGVGQQREVDGVGRGVDRQLHARGVVALEGRKDVGRGRRPPASPPEREGQGDRRRQAREPDGPSPRDHAPRGRTSRQRITP